ncbi:hypothetical protein GCM10009592_26520 [Brachybacterium rhamnosum]|uniref:Uncharacterized protein n=1 Tax=Brachybacterium rhamnosum TaxID=173361 RepID=A0ABW4Q1C3_9MICO
MGVKVKLADAREVGDKKYAAGDVVEVEASDARLLVALGAGGRVSDDEKAAAGEAVPDAVPGAADESKDKPAAGDEPAADDKGKASTARRKG